MAKGGIGGEKNNSSLFRILVVQDFQKFLKSLKPLCRPLRKAFHFGEQLGDFGFLGWQIEAAGMLVHIGERVRLFPNHRFHSRRYFLYLARVGDDLLFFSYLYWRAILAFFAGWRCTDTEYLFVGLMHDELFDPTTMQRGSPQQQSQKQQTQSIKVQAGAGNGKLG
jgi:hypothetical protein